MDCKLYSYIKYLIYEKAFILVLLFSNYLNTAKNHDPYWGGTTLLLGARPPVHPAGYGPGLYEN